ncbi:hypothetical protein HDV02_005022 [Globomyces sp. JEL0801]|nr:hypothetical protein HDV02_005022 [Globomyces sp. JEL0801]
MGERKQPSFGVNFFAGGAAGTIGAVVTCPLEVVKTRLQSSLYRANEVGLNTKNPLKLMFNHVNGVITILRDIRRVEGIRALWKGLTPNLIGIIPARSIHFGVYTQGKHYYSLLNNGVEDSYVHLISAGTASIATAVVTNPIWLIKTRMQLQSEEVAKRAVLPKYKNSFHCLTSVLKTEGLPGLYRGFSASMLGLVETAAQFAMYESFKKSLLNYRQKIADKSHPDGQAPKLTQLSWYDTTLASSSAKLIAAIATYPHEVLRTRLRQTPENGVRKYTGLWQSASLIYKQEGMAALYGGMTAHLMRVVPNAAILFVSFEFLSSFFNKL